VTCGQASWPVCADLKRVQAYPFDLPNFELCSSRTRKSARTWMMRALTFYGARAVEGDSVGSAS